MQIEKPFVLYAPNVHTGGGKTLLVGLLKAINKCQCIVILDERLDVPEEILLGIKVHWIAASFAGRLKGEYVLRKAAKKVNRILCFANLPPLFKLPAHVSVFVQNRYLVDIVSLKGFSLKTRIRLGIERIWFISSMRNACEIVVQTPSMKNLIQKRVNRKIPVRLLPFVEHNSDVSRKVLPFDEKVGKRIDFIYVASGEPHKNHRQLIEAWCLLAQAGVFPSLKITLDKERFSDLSTWVEGKNSDLQP